MLAVSGGIDSICLAHYFICNKQILGIKWLGICHVHHGLRNITADLDALLVENFAKQNNVPFFLKKLDGNFLKSQNGSLEENARNARYNVLCEVALLNNAHAIVTAHHANDQAETVYFRLKRGVSLAGLGGIQQIRNANELSLSTNCNEIYNEQSLKIYRPFLKISRKELEAYAKRNNLHWREDESNSDIKFARNSIRHNSLPYLETICKGASAQLCRIADLANIAYKKSLEASDKLFLHSIIQPSNWPFDANLSPYKNVLALNVYEIESILFNKNRIELFRLWLLNKGFRIQSNKSESLFTTPLKVSEQIKNILLEKCRNILWICDINKQNSCNNLYFIDEKFSTEGTKCRYIKRGDILYPLDERLHARKLETWLHQNGIPHWMYSYMPLIAQGSRILYVKGVNLNRINNKKEL